LGAFVYLQSLGEVPLDGAELLAHLVERRFQVLRCHSDHRAKHVGVAPERPEVVNPFLITFLNQP